MKFKLLSVAGILALSFGFFVGVSMADVPITDSTLGVFDFGGGGDGPEGADTSPGGGPGTDENGGTAAVAGDTAADTSAQAGS